MDGPGWEIDGMCMGYGWAMAVDRPWIGYGWVIHGPEMVVMRDNTFLSGVKKA